MLLPIIRDPRMSGLEIQVSATMHVLPAQALILALIEAEISRFFHRELKRKAGRNLVEYTKIALLSSLQKSKIFCQKKCLHKAFALGDI